MTGMGGGVAGTGLLHDDRLAVRVDLRHAPVDDRYDGLLDVHQVHDHLPASAPHVSDRLRSVTSTAGVGTELPMAAWLLPASAVGCVVLAVLDCSASGVHLVLYGGVVMKEPVDVGQFGGGFV